MMPFTHVLSPTSNQSYHVHDQEGHKVLTFKLIHSLSEEIAHLTVHHHLSQLSVDIQLNGLI